IQSNFDKKLFKQSSNEAILNFKFIVGTNGQLKWHSVKSENELFQEEGEKLLLEIPKYTSGMKDGERVNSLMQYAIKVVNESVEYKLEDYDRIPLNKNCLNSENNKQCFRSWLLNYINLNFNYENLDKTVEKGYTYSCLINLIITNKGNFEIKKIQAPEETIKTEITRVINSIPDVRPAEINGNPVDFPMKIPLKFFQVKD
ncbi:MAG: hypothetical protein R3218_09160, partial [Christiangramia sp.]|nr:hypothetical protein [Christiangramia sp.]